MIPIHCFFPPSLLSYSRLQDGSAVVRHKVMRKTRRLGRGRAALSPFFPPPPLFTERACVLFLRCPYYQRAWHKLSLTGLRQGILCRVNFIRCPRGLRPVGFNASQPIVPDSFFLFFAQVPRQRMRRVLLKDLIFVMEQEKETTKSLLLYKALLK